jgi:tetratricopeptide (TPR) repeat protein
VHDPLSAQNPQFATGEIHIPGTPITNAQVEAGLRKNREALRNTPSFQTHDAPTHFRLAEVLSQQGDPNGAIEEYQAAIQLNPEMAEAFRDLGAVYIDTHEWKKAEEALQKSVELNPQDHQAWYWLGRSHIAQEHFQQAQEALLTATRVSHHEAETFSDLGLAYMAQGHNQEAEAALKYAIDLQPDFAEAHHRLERARAAQDDPQELIRSAQQILHVLFRRE